MSASVSRRTLALGLSLLAVAPRAGAQSRAASALAAIERRHGGRLGVFAFDVPSGRTLAHRADERFLMCSTFKGLLAAQVLARCDAGAERLDHAVRYTERDLVFTSPVTKAQVARGEMPVGELCQAMVEVSDNTAAILLMRRSGGPAALTRFVRGLGDPSTRSDRYEPASNRRSGALDTTTPRAMAKAMGRILFGDLLSTESQHRLEGWMVACQPGLNRLRAALPADWRAGDRPGTNLDHETNDVAFVQPVGRTPLVIAAYYDAPHVEMDGREGVLREAGQVFVEWAKANG
jgi:beta-lactamase class A